ncbi:MAG: hypothetical protein AAF170_00210 [Bacteroidota bacterium]
MQQTILALAALLAFSIYMLTRHNVEAEFERVAITAEMELAATDIATQRLSEVLANAFDEVDIGREGTRSSAAGLSTIGTADPDEPDEGAFDDIDDYHTVTTSVTRPWEGEDLAFTDSVSVRYVDPANPDSTLSAGVQTIAKEVTITVFAAPVGFVGTPPIGARLRQVATPSTQAAYR